MIGAGLLLLAMVLEPATPVAYAASSQAATLVAVRPGLMCSSPDALARLTMHDGSSRTASARARPEDFDVKRQGGCIDIALGAHVILQEARRQTSIVLFDAEDGRGPRSYIVPNIDFAPAASTPVAADTGCYRYNAPIKLSGRVSVGSAHGDGARARKTGLSSWQEIVLDRPICTRESPATHEPAESNVRAVQPAWLGELPYPFVTGEHVTVEGRLFHRDNANQSTSVLIEATRVTRER
jgi:hypothetical protein